ncbi:polyketide synthase, putative [Talaromyces stipitatus ATCC 10500]|uniref:Polyketide synthase, putative n=1 Tax=Talaromyces stipitatus (strain ATCC 10500 / CBS 375.48 / QM 6759 / NRRL 1006) TaxID=441959 RepID=B8M9X6_TALSN|nr:polyketide synthase, putative [Talaromyces stipitatus ATCC 10500]EED18128.1 polyketide synthase, putative [Talaromyces stipitatus ATCC 10500]
MPSITSDGRHTVPIWDQFDGSSSESEIVDPMDYPAVSIPGYSEKPLNEQLEPIAVVGMGCRLPGDISSPSQFWDLMINKRTGQTPKVPASRFNIDAHFHENNERPGSFNVLGGYFLNSSLQEMDPVLFGISPIEAMWMDPQQRKLLEVVYETFESGGLTLDTLRGSKTAVFIGSFTSDYQQMSFKEPDFRHSYAATGVDPGLISNRISHVFDLNGPSIVVNTACSSSVYAMHNACNALRNNEAEAAIVGGVNLVLTVDQHMNTAKLGVLSPTSTCHTFDETADGYGRADGVGAVYLKRLGDAVRDGDPIRGVLRSSAVNSNGKVPGVGITHPNLAGQEAVIRAAYSRGGNLDPKLTGYFECHGTGTPIGDPLEVHAVAKAMNTNRSADEPPLPIGAVKTNIGHSEAASGLSAVIKAILTVEKGIIPPTRGVVKKNPKIDWRNWKVDVVTEPTPFPAHLPVRRVSVNSFGYGGTNGHVIVESADSFLPRGPTYVSGSSTMKPPRGAFSRNRPFLLPFSAHDRPTLDANIKALSRVASHYNLLDLSYTLSNRRSRLASRGYVVASYATLDSVLDNAAKDFSFAEKKKTPTLGFVFTGQGAQWARMGSELMSYYPSFIRSIRVLDRALEDLPDGPEWTLEDTLLQDASNSRVNEAEFSQPLCTAIQVSLVQLLSLWGIKPVVTVGHSSGEIAAAYAAGLISANEAIIAAYYRGKVVRDVNTDGAMLAVGLGAEGVSPYISDLGQQVVIACHNSPLSVTLSGDSPALELVKTRLDAESIFARIVKTGGKAYHSRHMEPVAAVYEELLRNGRRYVAQDEAISTSAKMVSSVTNSIISSDTIIDETYWSANLRSPVLFNQAVQTMVTSPDFEKVDMLVEIGPHSALSGPVKQIKAECKLEKLNYLPTLLRGEDCASQLLKLAGELFLRDYSFDIARATSIEESLPSGKIQVTKGSLIVDLPTYQWQYNKELWAEPRHSKEHRNPTHMRHDILGARLPGAGEMIWRNVLRMKDVPWLKSHSLGGEAVFPAAGYFSMAMEAITQVNEISSSPVHITSYVLRDVSIKAALITPDHDDGIEVIFTMRPDFQSEKDNRTGWWHFSASSFPAGGQRKDHITGRIGINARDRSQKPRPVPHLPHRASGKSWNQALRKVGFDYGPTFQDMENIRTNGTTYVAACDTEIRQKSGIMQGESRHVIHPGIVDSCLQLIIVSIFAGRVADMKCGAIPIGVDEVAIFPPTEKQIQEKSAKALSWTDQRGLRSLVSSSQLTASDGELLMEISDMRTTYYEAAVPQGVELTIESQPYQKMEWKLDIDNIKNTPETSSIDIISAIGLSFHKNPSLKVIDIGATQMAAVLSKMGSINYTGTGVNHEEVSDISKIADAYKNAQSIALDISVPLEGQGITIESYDLVVAPRSLMDSSVTTKAVRKLLAPHGRVFWSLEGRLTPKNLHGAQLTAFDVILGPNTQPSLAISTALNETTNGYHTNETTRLAHLIYRKKQGDVFVRVKNALEANGWDTVASPVEKPVNMKGANVVFLADLEGPFLDIMTEKEFLSLRNITDNASFLLWVTPGGLLKGLHPEYAMTAGLARSISSEQASIKITTLDFDTTTTPLSKIGDLVAQVTEIQYGNNSTTRESEYCVSNGLLYISRMVPNDELNALYAPRAKEPEPTSYDPTLHLIGKVDSGKIIFEADEREKLGLREDEVEIQVLATGITKEGTLVVGGTDYPTTFSHEIGGVITKLGSNVKGLALGDRVVGFSFDKFATFQRVSSHFVQKLGPDDSMNDAVSLLMSYGSALYGLNTLGNLQAGETVLILDGTGLFGAAAIKITQIMKGVPFVAVQNEKEIDTIKLVYDLSDKNIIKPWIASTTAQLKHATGKDGADIVFSSGFSNDDVAHEAWRCILPFGRFVDSGRKSIVKRTTMDTAPLHRGASYLSFDLLDLYRYKPAIISQIADQVISLFRQGTISPPRPVIVKNITELDEAISSFSDTISSPKTIIVYEPSDKTLNVIAPRLKLSFNENATYLLVGCLGGLGRSLTSWMMKHGARRFTFLSRSGADSSQAAHLVKDIESAGAIVQVVRGDATIRKDVDRAIAGVPASNPIRGVFQAAMVLRDGIFSNMSYNDWKTCTSPKVNGTRHLHEALAGKQLDFFVMTSSVSGTLGTPGQANYAAANAYLDALAHHRRSLGSAATAAVLPMVLGVGVVAENFQIEEALKSKGMYGIEEESLLETFEASVGLVPSPPEQTSSADHVIGGLDPLKLHKAAAESEATDIFWMDDARFSPLVRTINSVGAGNTSGSAESIINTIKALSSPAEAEAAIGAHFTDKLSRMLLIDLDEFEPDTRSIGDYGLDSMIGSTLRNWIFKEYELDIPFQQLVAPSLTITKFAKQVCAKHGIVDN